MSIYVTTINNVKRTIIYYDPDINTDDIIVSASLLNGDDMPRISHYNIMMDEDSGTAGTAFKPLQEIAIWLHSRPQNTKIIGAKRVPVSVLINYSIDNLYDPDLNYTYSWEVTGGNASILSFDKTGTLNTGSIETELKISVTICNPAGCCRRISKKVIVGVVPEEILVVRYPYL